MGKAIITTILEKLKITNPSRDEKGRYILMQNDDKEVCAVPVESLLARVNKRIDGIVYPDGFTKVSSISIVDNEISIPAGDFEWKIDLNPYKNVLFEQIIAETSDPTFNRIDSLAATNEGTIVYYQGQEVDETEIALPPIVPAGQLHLTDIYVLGSAVAEPTTPPITEIFTKEEKDKLAILDPTADIDKPVSTAQAAADADVLQEAKDYADAADTAAIAAANSHTDTQVSNLVNGEVTYYTLKKLADELRAHAAIIGGTAPDGDSVVNTVTELLAVMATFPEGVDLVTLLAGKVNVSDVYNALDCVVTGKVADARQLKVLNDALTALTTTVSGKEDSSNKVTDIEANKANAGKFGDIPSWITWLKNSYLGNLTAKATALVDEDKILIGDSEDSSKTKTRTFAQLLVTLGTRLATYFQTKDTKFYIGTSENVKDAWSGGTVYFTANCTITVPSTLGASFEEFGFRTMPGVTVTWAITAPFTWETTPSTTPEKTDGLFTRYNAGNTIIIRW
ncbi:hypothetical protein [Flavobacterium nitratireducens]|uniref:hypothetical protein n=1 Tax=Flavobacterium nitratireducens TaxID=992289 RepID=UPI0024150FC8|nr:hypothetical protein [Flavobacterium nitratireducens]